MRAKRAGHQLPLGQGRLVPRTVPGRGTRDRDRGQGRARPQQGPSPPASVRGPRRRERQGIGRCAVGVAPWQSAGGPGQRPCPAAETRFLTAPVKRTNMVEYSAVPPRLPEPTDDPPLPSRAQSSQPPSPPEEQAYSGNKRILLEASTNSPLCALLSASGPTRKPRSITLRCGGKSSEPARTSLLVVCRIRIFHTA